MKLCRSELLEPAEDFEYDTIQIIRKVKVVGQGATKIVIQSINNNTAQLYFVLGRANLH